MRFWRTILALVLGCGLPLLGFAADHGGAEGHGGGEAHHGLPQAAQEVFHVGPIVVTNSMVVVWMAALLIIVFAKMATSTMREVPEGLQNFWEWLVESLYDFLGGVLGAQLVKKTFWFFATLFIFILATNWFGLVPGVGTVGWGTRDAAGHFHLESPWMRGGNADLNMTSAMALVFFALWTIWSFQALGVGGFFKHIFVGEAGGKGFMKIFMAAIFFFVGIIEVISITFRPISLSFRLFGNIFAGENILEAMMAIVPWLGWILPLPFYFLELLVGLVQALVFTLLTAVFTALMCAGHHDDEHAAHDGHGAPAAGGTH